MNKTHLLLAFLGLGLGLAFITPLLADPSQSHDDLVLNQYQEGLQYLNGREGHPKNPAKAAEIFHELSDINVAAAQFMLARQYEKGNGVA